MFCCVGVFCCFCFCLRVVFYWLVFLFCSLCLLEWSRCCCFWFVLFLLLYFVYLCLFLSVFYMKIIVFPAILVLLLQCWFNLCFLFQCLVLAFCCCLVYILFQDVPLFILCVFFFFFSACCLVLNHNMYFLLLCILFSCCVFLFFALVFCYSLILATHQKYLSKNWKFRKPQNEKRRKTE